MNLAHCSWVQRSRWHVLLWCNKGQHSVLFWEPHWHHSLTLVPWEIVCKRTLSQKRALVIRLLKLKVTRTIRQLSVFPTGLLPLLSGWGLNDSSDSLGGSNLCGTAVISRACAALLPVFQPAPYHDITQLFLPPRAQWALIIQGVQVTACRWLDSSILPSLFIQRPVTCLSVAGRLTGKETQLNPVFPECAAFHYSSTQARVKPPLFGFQQLSA